MEAPNPYAAPTTASSGPARDDIDLYIESLPTQNVRAAGIAALIGGISALLVLVQSAMVLAQTLLGPPLLALIVLTCGMFFTVSRYITRAKRWASILGFATALLSGLISIVVLVLVSFVGVINGLVAMANLVLLAISFPDVLKMANARALLAKSDRANASTATTD